MSQHTSNAAQLPPRHPVTPITDQQRYSQHGAVNASNTALSPQSTIAEQTAQAKLFIGTVLEHREELIFTLSSRIANTIIMLEQRLWFIWDGSTGNGDPVSRLQTIDWKSDIDKTIVMHVVTHKRTGVTVLTQPNTVVVIARLLSNYFNTLYHRILNNERIDELHSMQHLTNYSAFTLLYIWAHQTANIHLAINRLELSVHRSSREDYIASLGKQLNMLLNSQRASIEAEVCNVSTDWTLSTGDQPFEFTVELDHGDMTH